MQRKVVSTIAGMTFRPQTDTSFETEKLAYLKARIRDGGEEAAAALALLGLPSLRVEPKVQEVLHSLLTDPETQRDVMLSVSSLIITPSGEDVLEMLYEERVLHEELRIVYSQQIRGVFAHLLHDPERARGFLDEALCSLGCQPRSNVRSFLEAFIEGLMEQLD